MLIRIDGASSGIVSYLRDGKKTGRIQSRDELDQRVSLQGNLTELEAVLNSFDLECKTQKYFHITLSFKESYIDEEILQKIDNDFREFIFSACAEDEFYYHSEIHFPKIKSLTDAQGKSYERFPHIHVVIPEFNLYTGKRDNPLGFVESITYYINAFQELTNEKYALESPKDNIREIHLGREEIIARYEINPELSNKEIKQKIFALIRENPQISNVEELSKVISAFGEVTLRDSTAFGQPYLNLKIAGKAKGINLKDPVFLNTYLANRDLSMTYQFTHEDNQKLVEQWQEYAALATRFVGKASKKAREAYAELPLAEKKLWLSERWQKHLENIGISQNHERFPAAEIGHEHSKTAYAHIDDIPHLDDLPHIDDVYHVDEIQHLDEIPFFDSIGGLDEITQGDSQFNLHELRIGSRDGNRGQRESQVTQGLLQGNKFYDLDGDEKNAYEELYALPDANPDKITNRVIESLQQHQESQTQSWSDLINHIESRGFLNYLSYHFGLDTTDLKIEKNKSGNERIVVEGRRYSASDFLTKRMHLSWSEAKVLLQTISQQQQFGEQRRDAITSQLMWQRFMRYEASRESLSSLKHAYYAQRREIYQRFKYHYNHDINRGENAAKRRLVYIQKKAELNKIQQEYEEKSRYFRQRLHERYLEFLYEEAEKGNRAALGELNRIYPLRHYSEPHIFEIHIKTRSQPKQPFNPIDMGYQVKIQRNGTIEYRDEHEKTVIVDTYHSIKVMQRNEQSIINALELAKLRYGTNGFEIRNASENDLAIIKAAAQKTGTEISIVNDDIQVKSIKKSKQEYGR